MSSPSPKPSKPSSQAASSEDPVTGFINFITGHPRLVIVLVSLIALSLGWRKLTAYFNQGGRPLPGLMFTIKRALRLMFSEDDTNVVMRPRALAIKLSSLTWKKYWIGLTVFTLLANSPLISLVGVQAQTWISLIWILGWVRGIAHLRTVFRYRHGIMMQMFEVASAECKYPKGAELNPWAYIQISKWNNLYQPDVTAVAFPARYRSEDQRNRDAFEQNFNGTVSDEHTWMYKWESSKNRVICSPVPFITDDAPYPFPDMYEWNQFPLGISAGGKDAIWDCAKFPHLLVAGTTGSGKSVTQRTLLLHALQKKEWKVVLIDPKRVELSPYEKHSNVLRVSTELDDSVALIEQVEQEMQSRYLRMQKAGVNFFMDLPDRPYALLMMVDETFALLSPENIKSEEGKERDELHARATLLIGSIARLGRAAGVHMILATQRPDAKVIPGETKANLDARIAQGRMDTTPSLMTLDSDAATKLPAIKGRAVLRTGNDFNEFQAYFLPQDRLDDALGLSQLIVDGKIDPQELLDEMKQQGQPEQKKKKRGRKQKDAESDFDEIPEKPAKARGRVGAWLEKREAQVAANESRSGRNREAQEKQRKQEESEAKRNQPIQKPAELSVAEAVAEFGIKEVAPPPLLQSPPKSVSTAPPPAATQQIVPEIIEVDEDPFELPEAKAPLPEIPSVPVVEAPAPPVIKPTYEQSDIVIPPAAAEPVVTEEEIFSDVVEAPWMPEVPAATDRGPSPFAPSVSSTLPPPPPPRPAVPVMPAMPTRGEPVAAPEIEDMDSTDEERPRIRRVIPPPPPSI